MAQAKTWVLFMAKCAVHPAGADRFAGGAIVGASGGPSYAVGVGWLCVVASGIEWFISNLFYIFDQD